MGTVGVQGGFFKEEDLEPPGQHLAFELDSPSGDGGHLATELYETTESNHPLRHLPGLHVGYIQSLETRGDGEDPPQVLGVRETFQGPEMGKHG